MKKFEEKAPFLFWAMAVIGWCLFLVFAWVALDTGWERLQTLFGAPPGTVSNLVERDPSYKILQERQMWATVGLQALVFGAFAFRAMERIEQSVSQWWRQRRGNTRNETVKHV